MIDEQKFRKFQKLIQSLERERDEAAGELKQIEKQLKKEFKVKSYKEGEILLQRMKKDLCNQYKKFAKQYNECVTDKKNRKRFRKVDGIDKALLRPIPTKLPRGPKGKATNKKAKS